MTFRAFLVSASATGLFVALYAIHTGAAGWAAIGGIAAGIFANELDHEGDR